MKKVLLSTFILAGLLATSCKKDRTCTCTTTTTGLGNSVIAYEIKDTKKKAEDKCESLESSSSAGGFTVATTCELD